MTFSIILLFFQAVSFSQNNNHSGWDNTPLKDFTFYNSYFSKYSQWSHNSWDHNKYPWNHSNKEWTNIFLPWGNVGIGTIMPESKFHVVGSSLFEGKITADTLEVGTDLQIGNNLIILGKIGIGVENPTEKLEVDGNIKATSLFIEDSLSANTLAITTLTTQDIFVSGNIGIGIEQPESPLHVNGIIRSKGIICEGDISTTNLTGTEGTFSNLAISSKLGIGVDSPSEALEVTGNGIFSGHIESNSIETGDIVSTGNLSLQNNMYINGNASITGSISAEKLTVNTIESSSGVLAMNEISTQNINVEEGLTIGTEDLPEDYMLAVNGNVIAEKIKVRLFADWPDYVFADNYKLKSISSLEKFIQTNNHLPGMPSAKEMEKEDVDLGEMQVKLLEKVEELTLYIIELNKENEALKERITQIEAAAE